MTQLFWYDRDGVFSKSFPVMMWNAADHSVVIPQTNVGSGSGTYDATTGYWGIAISPVTLSAGSTYVIGGYTLSSYPVEDQITDLATSPAITYQQDMIVTGGSIAYPLYTLPDYEKAWIGPNFGVDTDGPGTVPEPGTLLLVVLTLGIGVLVNRRRHRESRLGA